MESECTSCAEMYRRGVALGGSESNLYIVSAFEICADPKRLFLAEEEAERLRIEAE